MERKKKTIVGIIIKLVIVGLIVGFVYACYHVDFLMNNKYVINAKKNINSIISKVKEKTGDLSYIVENYESDDEDTKIYEINNSQDRFFYDQLDEPSKIIYAEILNNLDKLKKGEDNIKISSKLATLVDTNNLNNSLMVAFQNAWDAFRNDNVDVFYIDGTKMCLVSKTVKIGSKTNYEFYISKGKNDNYLVNGFNNLAEVEQAINYVKTEENKIINQITEKNEYYKIVKVHNWIVDNVSYNLEGNNTSNIYGALYDKEVVCEGYARLFKSLMDKLDIPCVMISGEGINSQNNTRESHAWNYVYLKGDWYAVDCTWDDPIIVGKGKVSSDTKYKYFLKGRGEFFNSHKEKGQLVDGGMQFLFPKISEYDYIRKES